MQCVPLPFKPTRLEERLSTLWGDRLRVRWSPREAMWHIEQKLEQGARQLWPGMAMPSSYLSELNDAFVRRRDGYTFVMRIARGDWIECPVCHRKLAVPVHEIGVIQCDPCSQKGKVVRLLGGYWDLGGELLIDALRKMDPDGRYLNEKAVGERVDQANATKEHWRENAMRGVGQDSLKDAFMDTFPKAGFPSLTSQEWRMN